MTSFSERPNTALLVIDMQQDVVAQAVDVESVVQNINTLVAKARSAQVPVVWVQHADAGLAHGSDGWQLVVDLSPDSDEAIVHKSYGDSFADTTLESVLEQDQVGRLIVTGAQTDACIRSTLHGALSRGYDVTLVGDAHTTEDMRQWGSPLSPEQAIAYTNMYWQNSHTGDSRGATVATTDVAF